jgi:hypothetical protein
LPGVKIFTKTAGDSQSSFTEHAKVEIFEYHGGDGGNMAAPTSKAFTVIKPENSTKFIYDHADPQFIETVDLIDQGMAALYQEPLNARMEKLRDLGNLAVSLE